MSEQEQEILDADIEASLQAITVYVATTWIKIKCNRYAVTPDGLALADFIRKTLYEREWNPRIRTLSITAKYLYYNNSEGMAYFPRYALDKLEEYIKPFGYKLKKKYIDPVEPKEMYSDIRDGVQLRENQIPVVEFLTDIDRNPNAGTFKPLSFATGLGKSVVYSTPIKTPGGWTAIENLHTGDSVMTVDGTYVPVTGVYPQGKLSTFTVTFEDNRSIDTSADHLWTTYDKSGVCEVLNTKQINESLVNGRSLYIDLVQPEVSENIELPMPIEYYGTHGVIPEECLNASHRQRFALFCSLCEYYQLQFHAKRKYIIRITDEITITRMIYLVRSLGGKAYQDNVDKTILHIDFSSHFLKISSVVETNKTEECVCISVDHPSHLYVAEDFIVTHNTICAIYSSVKIGYTTLIILQGLIDQWLQSILKFTDISTEDIYIIKGGPSIVTLWHKIKEGYRPKVIIGSTRTMANYILEPEGNYKKIPSFTKLCEAVGIGIKIVDECHLNFATNCMIDLHSNIKVNIYLSATYQRSSRDGRRIFNMYFPEKLKYGSQFIKKYTTVEMVYYHLCIPQEDLGRFKSDRGYNHAVYEKYLRKRGKYMKLFVNEVIYPLVDSFYCEKAGMNQHCLILVKTRDFAEELYSRLAKKLVNTSMAIFFSGDQGIYGLEENLHKDIIISTISSCGTGRDIKGLKTCICTVSMSSQPQSLQCLGRLREIPGEDVFYVDLCNEEIYSQRQHASLRTQYFKSRVKEITEFKIR